MPGQGGALSIQSILLTALFSGQLGLPSLGSSQFRTYAVETGTGAGHLLLGATQRLHRLVARLHVLFEGLRHFADAVAYPNEVLFGLRGGRGRQLGHGRRGEPSAQED